MVDRDSSDRVNILDYFPRSSERGRSLEEVTHLSVAMSGGRLFSSLLALDNGVLKHATFHEALFGGK